MTVKKLKHQHISAFVMLSMVIFIFFSKCSVKNSIIHIYCQETNDLYQVLQTVEGLQPIRYNSINALLAKAGPSEPVLILADEYPEVRVKLSESFFEELKNKGARFYVEYADGLPGIQAENENVEPKYKRAIVNSSFFSRMPDSLAILAVNGLIYIPVRMPNAHIVAGRVAGLDYAVYGLPEETSPLLFEMPGYPGLVATTGFSQFITGRYAPKREWKGIWKGILQYLLPDISIDQLKWTPVVETTYQKHQELPPGYQKKSIASGINWFTNAKILIPDGYDEVIEKAYNEKIHTGFIPWAESIPSADGSNGIFECIFSNVDERGNQPIGIVRRGDCTGEAAMAFASAGKALGQEEFYQIASNLLDFYLKKSPATKKEYGDPKHGAYGLISWGFESYAWFKANYGDDNARLLLGALVTAAITGKKDWDPILMRLLLAQVRTTGKNGFRGDRIDLPEFNKNGWEYFHNRDIINLSPHMEAYLWACFLWAYDKTGDPIFLERTKKAIKTTMENYPHGWKWMNGLAQERARILLPLSWLIRIEDTEENRKMLYKAIDGLLELQEECGAIREELGRIEKGVFPPTRKNEEYGLHEAPLIAKNGDPVSDLLYTTNFAFLGLHEAYYSTKDERIKKAVDKLAEFLCRIQVKSENHPELHGGWMRAFDFERFEHWGSNADAGWGAWAIESGWTQGWITTVLSLREMDTSVWDLTKGSKVGEHHKALKKEMLPGK